MLSSWHSQDDQMFLDNVTTSDLRHFRDSTFPPQFIAAKPNILLESDWVDVAKLKDFLGVAEPMEIATLVPTIKPEKLDIESLPVKAEPHDHNLVGLSSMAANGNSSLQVCHFEEDGHEIIEILSDSDLAKDYEGWRWWQGGTRADGNQNHTLTKCLHNDLDEDEANKKLFNPSVFVLPSDTNWNNAKIMSTMIVKEVKVTSMITVQHVKYLTTIPTLWPIPHVPTSFILDLWDEKYEFFDKNDNLMMPDALIKNKAHIGLTTLSYRIKIRGLEGLGRLILQLVSSSYLEQIQSLAAGLA
ncbi:hypothetical protein DXG01_000558 [Tephrocybe rancida]|nr:hypothetical protein DXG01_000558 [Tephrocybe rancida]